MANARNEPDIAPPVARFLEDLSRRIFPNSEIYNATQKFFVAAQGIADAMERHGSEKLFGVDMAFIDGKPAVVITSVTHKDDIFLAVFDDNGANFKANIGCGKSKDGTTTHDQLPGKLMDWMVQLGNQRRYFSTKLIKTLNPV